MQTVNAYIDLRAIIHNIKVIKKHAESSKIIAVVKANAYGHGVSEVAEVLNDYVDGFAVARLDEALYLKKFIDNKTILILGGLFDNDDLLTISRNDINIVLHNYELLRKIEKLTLPTPIKCWLKLDTGMHRLGVSLDQADQFYNNIIKCNNIAHPIGLLSHLCVADNNNDSEFTLMQISKFKNFKYKHPELKEALANSAGVFAWRNAITEWVRPGIVLYGISPFDNKTGKDLGLKPVMTLKSNIIAIQKVSKGEGIGYGLSYRANEDTYVGIIGIGYGDGYPRQMPNGTPVLINNRTVYTAGHVCMDMMFVDLGINCKDQVGDEVILWGDKLPVETIAKKVGTIPYELVLRLTSRVQFTYIKP